eukprot:6484847-Amphidinium_carterae.2
MFWGIDCVWKVIGADADDDIIECALDDRSAGVPATRHTQSDFHATLILVNTSAQPPKRCPLPID